MMVGLGIALFWFNPEESSLHIPLWAVAILIAIAILGEVIEFAAGAAGVGKKGGAKRSAALAVVGSLLGGIFGLVVGSPIPVIGNVVGAVLFAGIGAAGGAILGERWVGKNWEGSIDVGVGAFWGRLFGTIGKSLCGVAQAVLFLFQIWF